MKCQHRLLAVPKTKATRLNLSWAIFPTIRGPDGFLASPPSPGTSTAQFGWN